MPDTGPGTRPLWIKGLLIAASAVVVVASGMGFAREYRFAVLLRGDEAALEEAVRGLAPGNLPRSGRELRMLVTACADLLLQSERLRLVPGLREEVAGRCRGIAASVLAASPSHARARAAALVAAGGAIAAPEYALAQAAAPFEPWPLGTRLLAAERALSAAGAGSWPPGLEPLVAEDADRAMRERWGRELLAGIYLRQPALRPFLARVAEGRPEDEQRAFLDATRRGARGDG